MAAKLLIAIPSKGRLKDQAASLFEQGGMALRSKGHERGYRAALDGLDGVEVFYPSHGEEQTRLLYETCTSRGLLTTGSADFHGPQHDKFSVFGGFELYGLEPVLGPLA